MSAFSSLSEFWQTMLPFIMLVEIVLEIGLFMYQLLPDVVIDGKCAVILRRGKVTEHKLCRFLVGIFFPYSIDVIDAGIDFTALKIRQHIV